MDKRRRLERDIAALSPDGFQRLVHDLVKKEHPNAVLLTAPDGGADTLIPASNGRDAEVFQSKHCPRPSKIKWSDCIQSLETALTEHEPERITFAFSRIFTKNDERSFREKLAKPYPNVEVDLWQLSDVADRLEGHADLKTRHFGRDTEEAIDAMLRAAKVGGQLQTTRDLVERAHELGAFLGGHDRDFDYRMTMGAAPLPEPHWGKLDRPFMGMLVRNEEVAVRVDAWAREGVEAVTSLSFTDDEAGSQALEFVRLELAAGREAVVTSGVHLSFTNAPKLLQEAFEGQELHSGLEITMRPGGPTPVEIEITTPDEVTTQTFDFRPVPPSEPGHVALAFNSGHMFAELDFLTLEKPTIRFGFRATGRFGEDATANLETARFLDRFFNHTKVVFRCRKLFPNGELEGVQMVGTDAERAHLAFRRAIYEDLVLIEERCEIDFVLPDHLSRSNLEEIRTVGEILRTGTGTATFHGAEGTVEAANVPQATEFVFRHEEWTRPVEYTVLEHRLNLGLAKYELPPLKVVEVIPHGQRPDAPARVKIAADGDDQVRFRLIDVPSKAA